MLQELSVVVVTRVETRAVRVPLPQPQRTAAGVINEAPLLLVDLHTDEGVTGRSYLFGYWSFTLRPLADLIQALVEDSVVGKSLAPLEIERRLRSRLTLIGSKGLAGMAVAAIDMAAWDALAQLARLPLVQLLGGSPKPLRAYESFGMCQPAEAAASAAASVGRGFRALKFKIGWPSLAEDMAVVKAIRGEVGHQILLMVDFNQSLSVVEAIRRGAVLDSEGLGWIEEPVRANDFAGSAQIAARLDTPIQAGESWSGVGDFSEAIRVSASDLLMPDVQQVGGVTGWMQVAALAHAAGKGVSSHVFVEFSSHLLACSPTADWLEYLDLAGPILAEPFPIVQGTLTAPSRAGSGLLWDEAAIRRLGAA